MEPLRSVHCGRQADVLAVRDQSMNKSIFKSVNTVGNNSDYQVFTFASLPLPRCYLQTRDVWVILKRACTAVFYPAKSLAEYTLGTKPGNP